MQLCYLSIASGRNPKNLTPMTAVSRSRHLTWYKSSSHTQVTTDLQKPLQIYTTHTRENPKSSSEAWRTQISFLPRFFHHGTGVMSGGCWRHRAGSPEQQQVEPGHSSRSEMMLFPLHGLLQMVFTSRSRELDRSDTVKLYLLVLELCGTENEKSCSQPQTPQKSHSHIQQFCKDSSPTIQTWERFRLLR